MGEPPQRPTGTCVQSKDNKGWIPPAWERQQMQTRGAGRRKERKRMAGAGRAQMGSGSHRERRWGAGEMRGL